MHWFLENRADLAAHITWMAAKEGDGDGQRLLAIPTKDRLVRVLRYVLDEGEFLSPHGVRSMSKVHERDPFVLRLEGAEYQVHYAPAESDTGLFGGNSNWRGPVWFPLNYLLIEALGSFAAVDFRPLLSEDHEELHLCASSAIRLLVDRRSLIPAWQLLRR